MLFTLIILTIAALIICYLFSFDKLAAIILLLWGWICMLYGFGYIIGLGVKAAAGV
jgi:hypothetical protein